MKESDRVYSGIQKFLLEGRYQCGEPINEKQLLEELNTGRTPLREALTRLSQEGFVSIFSRKGMVFFSLNLKEVSSIFNLRLELAPYHARLLIQNVKQEQIDQIRVMLESCTDLGLGTDYLLFDLHFHNLINNLTNDRFLSETLDRLQIFSCIILRPHYEELITNVARAYNEYAEVLDALIRSDQNDLTNSLINHIPKSFVQY